jgi:hypothetical protein
MHRTTTLVVGLAAALAAGLFAVRYAGAEDEGMPTIQKKVDHPFVKHILGTWDYVATGEAPGKGTVTWSLGVGETAVFEDLSGTMMGEPFAGHGMWKIAADGGLRVWWLDNYLTKPDAYVGKITADGYELKEDGGKQGLKLRKTDKGLELQLSMENEVAMTVTLTKKK